MSQRHSDLQEHGSLGLWKCQRFFLICVYRTAAIERMLSRSDWCLAWFVMHACEWQASKVCGNQCLLGWPWPHKGVESEERKRKGNGRRGGFYSDSRRATPERHPFANAHTAFMVAWETPPLSRSQSHRLNITAAIVLHGSMVDPAGRLAAYIWGAQHHAILFFFFMRSSEKLLYKFWAKEFFASGVLEVVFAPRSSKRATARSCLNPEGNLGSVLTPVSYCT